jgi:hypothetical protein
LFVGIIVCFLYPRHMERITSGTTQLALLRVLKQHFPDEAGLLEEVGQEGGLTSVALLTLATSTEAWNECMMNMKVAPMKSQVLRAHLLKKVKKTKSHKKKPRHALVFVPSPNGHQVLSKDDQQAHEKEVARQKAIAVNPRLVSYRFRKAPKNLHPFFAGQAAAELKPAAPRKVFGAELFDWIGDNSPLLAKELGYEDKTTPQSKEKGLVEFLVPREVAEKARTLLVELKQAVRAFLYLFFGQPYATIPNPPMLPQAKEGNRRKIERGEPLDVGVMECIADFTSIASKLYQAGKSKSKREVPFALCIACTFLKFLLLSHLTLSSPSCNPEHPPHLTHANPSGESSTRRLRVVQDQHSCPARRLVC